MKISEKILILILVVVVPFIAYTKFSTANSGTAIKAEEIKKTLLENPKILQEVLQENKAVLNTLVLEILRDNKELLIDIIEQGVESRRRNQLQSQWEEDIKTKKNVNIKDRPTRGNANAPVTLIAFSDFACTYCAQGAATIENLIQRYPNIRFIFKQSVSESPAAQNAARWFLAAIEQDEKKGWNFYAALFSNQKEFFANPEEALKKVATQAGLNVKTLEADLKKNYKKYNAIIEEDSAEAKKLGFNGTPYYLMNDAVIAGALPLESFINAYNFVMSKK